MHSGRMQSVERTWLVVADGGRGRVLEDADGRLVSAIPHDLIASRLPTRDPARLAVAPSTDGLDDEHQQNLLAQRLAEVVHQGRVEHRFDRLVLIAPPEFLGRLRESIDPVTRATIVAEACQDLCSASARELGERLTALLEPDAS